MKKYFHGTNALLEWKPGMKWRCRPLGSNDRFIPENAHDHGLLGLAHLEYEVEMPDEVKDDIINEPPHYIINIEGKEFDCRAVQKALGMYEHHCLASAFAYLWRALHKGAMVSDIEKAINFLKEELEYQKTKEKK